MGFAALSEAFPKYNAEPSKILWDCLNDLKDRYYIHGIYTVIRQIEDIYPGTNIVAKIRGYAAEERLRVERIESKRLTDAKYLLNEDIKSKPPQEWEDLKRKLGIK